MGVFCEYCNWALNAPGLQDFVRGYVEYITGQKIRMTFKRSLPANDLGLIFTPQPLRAPGYCRRPSGRAGGRQGKHSHVHNFSRIIFKLGKDIYYPTISDELDHGGSASLNMRLMDHLMSWPLLTFLNSLYTTKLLGGYTGFTPSVRPFVRPSRMPCLLCNIYSYEWILFILGTNDHYHKRVCSTPWPLTLTYIFKVIWPWLRKSCPLCSVYSSRWILFIFGTNDHYYYRVCRVLRFFSESGNLNFGQIFEIFRLWPWKKNLQFLMDSFYI